MRLRVMVFVICVLAVSVMPGAARAADEASAAVAAEPGRRTYAGLLLVTGLWVVALRSARAEAPPRIVVRGIDHVE